MPITISDTTPRVVTVVGGTPQTAFTVSFEWFTDADLKVYKDGVLQSLTTHSQQQVLGCPVAAP